MAAANAEAAVVFRRSESRRPDIPKEIHWMPCRIEHTGPANVSQYLLREKTEGSHEIYV